MTKEQFIKRVEEITGYILFMKNIYDSGFKIFWFKSCNVEDITLTISNSGIMCESGMNPRYTPNEWLFPLGEAIKEYYDTKS